MSGYTPRPVWLAREDIGLAHAFVAGEHGRSHCGRVEQPPEFPWPPAPPTRERCKTCVAAVERGMRAEQKRPFEPGGGNVA